MSPISRPDLSGVDALTVNLTHRVCLGDLPTRAAHTYGDRIAIIDGEQQLTYRELEACANRLARGLLARGALHGDVIALHLLNRWEFVAAFFACAKIGVAVLPLNLLVSPDDAAYQLRDSGARWVISQEAMRPALAATLSVDAGAVEEVLIVDASAEATSTADSASQEIAGVPARGWDEAMAADDRPVERIVEDRDIAQLLYTSGTTSRPKGVATSHVAAQLSVLSSAIALGSRPNTTADIVPIVLPLFHVTALNAVLLPTLATGGTAILLVGFVPDQVVRVLTDYEVTHLVLLPAMWAAVLAHPALEKARRATLRTALYAMAPMPAAVRDRLRATFPQAAVILGSGQTETTPVSQMQWPGHQGVKDDSWGPAVVTTDVQIMGPDGALLGPGEEGEIVYRTPQLMEGYLGDPSANTDAFAHGWFRGGDIGYLDDEGVVWFTDRAKDMVKSGGENVSSVEVERTLLEHPDVAECAVVGIPDDRWGERVTAYVVATPGAEMDPAALITWSRERLAGFKTPKEVVVVEALPKTATGKVIKAQVRARHG